jgi:Uma2 family endonuclease
MAAPRSSKPATFADLAALGDDVSAEIIHGAITEKAAPSPEHSRTQAGTVHAVYHRYGRRPGGRWPGGWWILTEVEAEYESHELFRHDVAGWRRDRVPTAPTERPIRIRPDWACEILSPSNAKRDRVDKLHVLHGAGVPHYWLLDPAEKTLEVHRWTPAGYVIVRSASSGETIRAEPFDAVELRVDVLFGDDDDDE